MVPLDGIGTLDKRITLYKLEDTEDANGLTSQRMVDAIGHAIWARIEPSRGKTLMEGLKDKNIDVIKFTVRYRPGISENWIVGYRGKYYEILSVVDPYEDHVKLELYCQLKERGEHV